MNNRQYIRFYIDRNDKLRAIWYKQRSYKQLQSDGYVHSDDFTHDFGDDPTIAVRSVAIKRSCDKQYISKVRYCYTEDEAKATIDARLNRNKEASPSNLTYDHFCQLVRAPMKYVEYFLDFIGGMYGEDERDAVVQEIIKATHDKELRHLWTEQSRKLPNNYGDLI